VQNVRYRRVALGKLRVLLERTEDVPAPRAVDWVLRQPIHVEKTLHGLRTMDVVPVIELLHRRPITRLRQTTKYPKTQYWVNVPKNPPQVSVYCFTNNEIFYDS